MCILEEFKRLCCVLCYLGSLTLLRTAEGCKEGETQRHMCNETWIRWGFSNLYRENLEGTSTCLLSTAQGEGLANLYVTFCIMAVVGYKHPGEDSVASLCTHWSKVLNHFWGERCHLSWAWPIWVTALTIYQEPIGLGALNRLASCQITHFLSTLLTQGILCSLKKGLNMIKYTLYEIIKS